MGEGVMRDNSGLGVKARGGWVISERVLNL